MGEVLFMKKWLTIAPLYLLALEKIAVRRFMMGPSPDKLALSERGKQPPLGTKSQFPIRLHAPFARPPRMKKAYRNVNRLFSIEVEAIFKAEDAI